jgi:hypothetical protein
MVSCFCQNFHRWWNFHPVEVLGGGRKTKRAWFLDFLWSAVARHRFKRSLEMKLNKKFVVPALAGLLMVCTVNALELQYDGQTFTDCSMTRVELDGVSYMHSAGVVKIPFDQLPEAEQKQHQAALDALQAHQEEVARFKAEVTEQLQHDSDEQLRKWMAEEKARADAKAKKEAKQGHAAVKSERAKYDDLVAGMKECGFVHSINMTTHDVFVDPAIWNLLEYDRKELWVGVLSVYFDQHDGLSHVIICDKYNKKKLCKLAPFVGFKIY